jgi:hypothetical protein
MWDVRRGMWEMGRGMSDVEGRGVASNWAGVFKAPFTGSCGALASSPPTPLREVEIRRSAPSVSLRSTAPPLGARERAGRSWARQRPLTPFAARRDLSPRGGERGRQDKDSTPVASRHPLPAGRGEGRGCSRMRIRCPAGAGSVEYTRLRVSLTRLLAGFAPSVATRRGPDGTKRRRSPVSVRPA